MHLRNRKALSMAVELSPAATGRHVDSISFGDQSWWDGGRETLISCQNLSNMRRGPQLLLVSEPLSRGDLIALAANYDLLRPAPAD
jgi:hypothetical protein